MTTAEKLRIIAAVAVVEMRKQGETKLTTQNLPRISLYIMQAVLVAMGRTSQLNMQCSTVLGLMDATLEPLDLEECKDAPVTMRFAE